MEVRDQIYCFEIARRSVGRAAFHLGIESMTEAALDALADILLSYLNRVGRSLSHLVESSGRTSAHVNVLDALQACRMVTLPVVQHLHLRDPGADEETMFLGNANHSLNVCLNTPDWKGLAAFLFGPKWLEDAESNVEEGEAEVQGAGGKRGPSASANASGVDPSNSQQAPGWDAPYLDEVPHFPQASDSCANPHPLPPHVGLSLHRAEEESEKPQDTTETELQHVPDELFYYSSWGGMDQKEAASAAATTTRKRKEQEPSTSDATSSPPKKKVKIDSASKKSEKDKGKSRETTTTTFVSKHYPPRVPTFYPPPPSATISQEAGRLVVEPTKHLPQPSVATAAAADDKTKSSVSTWASQNNVRSSLVQMGQYWGSSWDAAPTKETKKMVVPLGRGDVNEGEKQDGKRAVVPLGRASGSRVSKILEGSMDAAAMQ